MQVRVQRVGDEEGIQWEWGEDMPHIKRVPGDIYPQGPRDVVHGLLKK